MLAPSCLLDCQRQPFLSFQRTTLYICTPASHFRRREPPIWHRISFVLWYHRFSSQLSLCRDVWKHYIRGILLPKFIIQQRVCASVMNVSAHMNTSVCKRDIVSDCVVVGGVVHFLVVMLYPKNHSGWPEPCVGRIQRGFERITVFAVFLMIFARPFPPPVTGTAFSPKLVY